MRPSDMDTAQRQREMFHKLSVPAGMWIVLRMDGRSFTKLTAPNFEKPFDAQFSELMVTAATNAMADLGGLYAYTESDEISILLPRDTNLFDRRAEKLVSVSASLATEAFASNFGTGHFDSRVWAGTTVEDVRDYFSWRQADAARCALNGWAYWTLRKEGMSARAATKALHGTGEAHKHELLHERGINFANLPSWQRRGIGIYWTTVEVESENPKTGQKVTATRRRIHVNRDLPFRAEYRAFIVNFVAGGDQNGTTPRP